MLQLIFPNKSHKLAYEKMIKEWWETENIPTSPAKLFQWENFEEFLEIVENDTTDNKFWVNSHLYFLVDDEIENEILWAIHIRHHINHPNLIEIGWHIWYWLAPKFRWKWIAKNMLSLGIQKAKELWINDILLTCDIKNTPSHKVIEANGWIFERVTNDWNANRYWINL